MKRRPSEFHSGSMAVLYLLSGTVLALMIIGTVNTKTKLSSIHAAPPAQTAPVIMQTKPEVTAAQISFTPLEDVAEKIVNILLVGKDEADGSEARSDAIILCTFNRRDDTITITSFLRDLYVKIPGHQSNRLNAAYRFGGIELLEQTLQENFGIAVDGNIQVDFAHFEQIMDMLGGVSIELTAAEAAFINKHLEGSALTEGTHLLSGKQALTYARNRYDVDGDFSRTNRQRKLLSELIRTYKSKKTMEMLRLMSEIAAMITTDISKSDMTTYALTLFPMFSSAQLRTQAIPVEGGYSYQTIGGKSVLVPDLEKNVQVLEETLT